MSTGKQADRKSESSNQNIQRWRTGSNMADRKLPKIQNKDNISEIKPKQQNKTVNQIQNCKDLQKLCGKKL